MATNSLPLQQPPNPSPLVTVEQEVLTKLHNGLHRIIYAHVGILVLLVALIGLGGYFGLRSYDKQVERAAALQQQFEKSQETAALAQKQLADIIAADNAARAQESSQQAAIEQQMLNRASQAPAPVVIQALQPSATAVDLKNGLESVFRGVSGFGAVQVAPGPSVLLNQAQTQAIITSRTDEMLISADIKDEVQLFTLESAKSTSLQKDLAQCQDVETKDQTALTDARKTIAAYDKLVNKSRFRKILGSIGRNAERVGILVGGIYLGGLIKK